MMYNSSTCSRDYPIDSMYGGYYLNTPDGRTDWFSNINEYNSYLDDYNKSSMESCDYEDYNLNSVNEEEYDY